MNSFKHWFTRNKTINTVLLCRNGVRAKTCQRENWYKSTNEIVLKSYFHHFCCFLISFWMFYYVFIHFTKIPAGYIAKNFFCLFYISEIIPEITMWLISDVVYTSFRCIFHSTYSLCVCVKCQHYSNIM